NLLSRRPAGVSCRCLCGRSADMGRRLLSVQRTRYTVAVCSPWSDDQRRPAASRSGGEPSHAESRAPAPYFLPMLRFGPRRWLGRIVVDLSGEASLAFRMARAFVLSGDAAGPICFLQRGDYERLAALACFSGSFDRG